MSESVSRQSGAPFRFLCALACCLLAACASSAGRLESPPAEPPAPVGVVPLLLAQEGDAATRLDVSLIVFGSGPAAASASSSDSPEYPQIRAAESYYLPFLLRQTLVASGAWGAVRVLPQADPSAELLVTGRIERSDGHYLQLYVQAVDSTGRTWIEGSYFDEAGDADYAGGDEAPSEPFQDLYNRVANELLLARRRIERPQLDSIAPVSGMRYARSLLPQAFEGYLLRNEKGLYEIVRLPSAGDPMLQRVERIRRYQHLFIDTADEQYAELYERMAPSYRLWRDYHRRQRRYQEQYRARLAERDSAGRRGSYESLRQSYDAYKWSKLQQQELQELALGFRNEVAPTVLEVGGRVVELSGNLESRQRQWQQILLEMFRLETGTGEGPR